MDKKEILFRTLADSTKSSDSIGARMSVGEDAIDETSPHVLQSYADTCAIKSQQLVLEKFGKYFTEDELVQLAYDNGWYRPGGGTKFYDMGEILRANDVPCTNYVNGNIAHVVSALADGKQIIMGVDSGELWEGSSLRKLWERIEDNIPLVGGADHALLVTGIDASDPSDVKVIVTDPGSGDLNKSYPLKQFTDAAEDSKFFMTITDEPTPNVFDAYEPGTMHLPKIGDMNYYEFMNQFSDYMQDGAIVPDSIWDKFKLSAFGASEIDIKPEVIIPDVTTSTEKEQPNGDEPIGDEDDYNTVDDYEREPNHHDANDWEDRQRDELDEGDMSEDEEKEDEEKEDEDNKDEKEYEEENLNDEFDDGYGEYEDIEV